MNPLVLIGAHFLVSDVAQHATRQHYPSPSTIVMFVLDNCLSNRARCQAARAVGTAHHAGSWAAFCREAYVTHAVSDAIECPISRRCMMLWTRHALRASAGTPRGLRRFSE